MQKSKQYFLCAKLYEKLWKTINGMQKNIIFAFTYRAERGFLPLQPMCHYEKMNR